MSALLSLSCSMRVSAGEKSSPRSPTGSACRGGDRRAPLTPVPPVAALPAARCPRPCSVAEQREGPNARRVALLFIAAFSSPPPSAAPTLRRRRRRASPGRVSRLNGRRVPFFSRPPEAAAAAAAAAVAASLSCAVLRRRRGGGRRGGRYNALARCGPATARDALAEVRRGDDHDGVVHEEADLTPAGTPPRPPHTTRRRTRCRWARRGAADRPVLAAELHALSAPPRRGRRRTADRGDDIGAADFGGHLFHKHDVVVVVFMLVSSISSMSTSSSAAARRRAPAGHRRLSSSP